MRDLAVPGNGDYDFYALPALSSSQHAHHVLARNTLVLAHNGGPGCGELRIDPDKIPHQYMRTSNAGVIRAEESGVTGPYNKANGGAFVNAISRFREESRHAGYRRRLRGAASDPLSEP
jgi:hypothetical protein